jgi:hypothetical protein
MEQPLTRSRPLIAAVAAVTWGIGLGCGGPTSESGTTGLPGDETTGGAGPSQPSGDHPSDVPTVFDIGTVGGTVTFSKTLGNSDATCRYWWRTHGVDVTEPCHGYRVTVPAGGSLSARLTWRPAGWTSWTSLAIMRERARPGNVREIASPGHILIAQSGSLAYTMQGVSAGETFVVTVGGGNPSVDYTLRLVLPTE